MTRFAFIAVLLFGGLFFNSNEAEGQVFSTKLRITVLDNLGNIVPGAEVTLYANKADYEKEQNPAQPTTQTDKKGRVTFKGLEPISYYVIVRKGDLTNQGGGEIIGDLEERKLNKANVIISDEL